MRAPSLREAARAALRITRWLPAAAFLSLVLLPGLVTAQEPVGTIVTYDVGVPGTPWLPDGWLLCNGQTVDDPESPYHGQALPDIEVAKRFLRGGDTSGVFQDDALQGHHHTPLHNAHSVKTEPEWGGDGSGQIKTLPATVDPTWPSDDGVNGAPRTANETRPVNIYARVILKVRDTAAAMPIGSVLAWHGDLPGTPPLPEAWVPCEGQVLNDPESVFHTRTIPDLNGDGRFIRGGTAGVLEDDAFQGHHHEALHDATGIFNFGSMTVWENEAFNTELATIEVGDPLSDGVNGPVRIAHESRPLNMSVRWVIKVKAGPSPVGAILSWHKDLAGTPILPSDYRECDGQLVADASSPYLGVALPDLNGEGRFLRGGPVSGVMQDDALQGHRHSLSHNSDRLIAGTSISGTASAGVGYSLEPAEIIIGDPVDDGWYGDPRTAAETRPKNMSVVWVMRSKNVWRDVGGAMAGTSGLPLLVGEGPLAPDESYRVTLSNAVLHSAVHLVVGTTDLMLPFKGGTLVPNPEFIVYGIPTVNGGLMLSSVWPAGTPSGLNIYVQFWIPDAAGPKGFAASNGIEGTSQDP
jgi:hypothetical protein